MEVNGKINRTIAPRRDVTYDGTLSMIAPSAPHWESWSSPCSGRPWKRSSAKTYPTASNRPGWALQAEVGLPPWNRPRPARKIRAELDPKAFYITTLYMRQSTWLGCRRSARGTRAVPGMPMVGQPIPSSRIRAGLPVSRRKFIQGYGGFRCVWNDSAM
jgi:hypothetical protein